MKKITMLFIMSLLLACSEDSGTGPGNNLGLGSFRVDIDGTRWNATLGFVFSSVFLDESVSGLSVSASKAISANSSEAIALTVAAPVSNTAGLERDYNLNGTESAALSFVMTNAQNTISYISVSGEITISNITSGNVTGTFNAVCVNSLSLQDTISLTNGSFNAEIISSP